MGNCCTVKSKLEEKYEECRDRIIHNKEISESVINTSNDIELLQEFLTNAPHFTSHNEYVNVFLLIY